MLRASSIELRPRNRQSTRAKIRDGRTKIFSGGERKFTAKMTKNKTQKNKEKLKERERETTNVQYEIL